MIGLHDEDGNSWDKYIVILHSSNVQIKEFENELI
jgi:hypothetical protein